MQELRRHNRFMLCLFAIGLLAGAAMTAAPAQAASGAGPYYAPPAWDRKLPAASRFLVLTNWGGAAVLDKETGLVWEKTPDLTISTWSNARFRCAITVIGNRQGWRLPSFPELASLLDRTVFFPGPMLPPGHPFGNVVPADVYWSASTNAEFPGNAWAVDFQSGNVFYPDKTTTAKVWCVRGGMNADAY